MSLICFLRRALRIVSSPPQDAESDLPFSFDAFIRPFPNLVEAKIIWTPFSEFNPRTTIMANAPSPVIRAAGDESPEYPNIQWLSIEIRDNDDYTVSDRCKIEQLGHLLRQLPSMAATSFKFNLGGFNELHAVRGRCRWFDLIAAMKGCCHPNLERIHLGFGGLKMNGRAIGVDFCVSLQSSISTIDT
jgi:hypothetical protein